MRRLYALILATLISSLIFAPVFAVEQRKVTQEDIEWGNKDNTVVSPGGHTGHKIPRHYDNNAFSDNTTLYANDLITKGPWVDVRAHGTITTDIGAAINAALAANPNGIDLRLPRGNFPCLTQINLDLIDTNGVVKITGIGTTGEPSTDNNWATIINGTGLGVPVMVGGKTKDKPNIFLRDFVIRGGDSDGLVLGTTAYVTTHSFVENITVQGVSGWGIKIYRSYGSWINKIYANQCGDGIYLYQNNASIFGIVTAREILGTTSAYSISIEQGWGWSIGTIYSEANHKGAFRIGAHVSSLTIGAIYSEGNNADNVAVYELLIGETAVPALSTNIKILNAYLVGHALGYDYTGAVIGVGKVNGLDISFHNYWVPAKILKLIYNNATNTPLTIRDASTATSSIDLSNAYPDGGIISIIGGSIESSAVTLPTTVQVMTLGGKNISIAGIFNKTVTDNGSTILGVNERHVYCNTATGNQTIYFHGSSYTEGVDFTITKTSSDNNTVTVGTIYDSGVVGTTLLTAQWNSTTYRYDAVTTQFVTIGKNF